jgi:hypothetical protein
VTPFLTSRHICDVSIFDLSNPTITPPISLILVGRTLQIPPLKLKTTALIQGVIVCLEPSKAPTLSVGLLQYTKPLPVSCSLLVFSPSSKTSLSFFSQQTLRLKLWILMSHLLFPTHKLSQSKLHRQS